MFVIPEHFQREMLALHEEEGKAWLQRLPAILAHCEQRWQLTIDAPFPNLSFHYTALATRTDGTTVVVKACSPTNEFALETEALRLYDGHGMARLLEQNTEDEVFLLEHLQPGTPLTHLVSKHDEEATFHATTVMQLMWRPVPAVHPFPTTDDWGKGFVRLRQHYDGGTGPFPKALLEEAETLYRELSASAAEPVLLHGDLHYDNILAAQRQPWLAIDPKGLIGEPAYEVGALLRNPHPQLLAMPDPRRVLARRVDQFSELLRIDRARIRGWGVAQAVLSVWWSIEDFGYGGEATLTCAELLATL